MLSGCAIKPSDGVCFDITYLRSYSMIYNMQCVIDISKNSQKMQWSMRIGTFLETGRLALKC